MFSTLRAGPGSDAERSAKLLDAPQRKGGCCGRPHRDRNGDAIREADKLCDNALASVWGEWRSRGVALWLAREDDVCRLPADSGWVLEGVRQEAICEGLELLQEQSRCCTPQNKQAT